MNEVIVIGAVVTFFACYGAYYVGYARGCMFQAHKRVGSMSKHDAMRLTIALEKLCDYTEAVANGKAARTKEVHH